MAGFRLAGVFLMGVLAGFGVALLTCATRLPYPRTLLEFSPVNSFLAGVVLLTLGALGCVAVAKAGKTCRLRTSLEAIAVIAALLGGVLDIRRRSSEFWGLAIQHRAQSATLYARYHLSRLDPRVTKHEAAAISTLASWHFRTAGRFDRAANNPWLPLESRAPQPR